MNENTHEVLDRRHRKRIQNRVAQRTYRNRIKQRVEELEREVQSYRSKAGEQARPQQSSIVNSDGSALLISPSNSEEEISAPGPTGRNTNDVHRNMVEEASLFDLSMAVDEPEPPSLAEQSLQQQRTLDSQSPSIILHDPSVSHPPNMKPQGQEQAVLPVGAQQRVSPGPSSQPFDLSVDWPWEEASIASFRPEQTQTERDLQHHGQHETINPNGRCSISSRSRPSETGSSSVSQTRGIQPQPLAERGSHGLSTPLTDLDGPTAESTSAPRNPAPLPSTYLQPQSNSIEDRLEYLRQCTLSAGFSSVDEAVGLYYTADLNHDTVISREQRKSRQTRLPRLLGTLRTEAEAWSLWEAHGYQHEIIQSAASVIRDEYEDQDSAPKEFLHVLSSLEGLVAEANDKSPVHNLHKAFRPLMRMVQDTSPKLCTLVESLLSTTDDLTQMQKSYALLSIIITLSISKHKDHVKQGGKLATACLSIVQGL